MSAVYQILCIIVVAQEDRGCPLCVFIDKRLSMSHADCYLFKQLKYSIN